MHNTYLSKALKSIFALAIFIIASHQSFSQIRLDNWQTSSSLYNVQSVSVDSKNRIWAGTLGGLFVYDEASDSSRVFRTTEGLFSLEISAVKCYVEKKLTFVGTSDGYLSIADEDFNWTHITSIVSAKFPNPIIKDIIFRDSLAYIAGGFGIAIYDINHQVFRETISRIGNFQQNTVVNKIIFKGNEIWAATELGLAKASLDTYLPLPDSWKTFSYEDKTFSAIALCEFNGDIYTAEATRLFRLESDSLHVLYSNPSYNPIKSFSIFDNKLYISSSFYISDINGNQITVKHPSQNINGHITYSRDSIEKIIIFYSDLGMGIIDKSNLKLIKTNSPSVNVFLSMVIDKKGNFWNATDKTFGYGFMMESNGIWTNYNNTSSPVLKTNNYYKVSSDNDKVTLSSWGCGVLFGRYADTGYVFSRYDTSNSPLTGVDSPGYVVVGETATDESGTTWMTNYGKTSIGPVMVAFDKNNNWHTYTNLIYPNSRYYLTIAIDDYGTKWLGSDAALPSGLLYYNERGTLDDSSDDICGTVTTSSHPSLPDNVISCIASDKTGVVWVGTPSGLATILNPSAVLSKSAIIIRKVTLVGIRQINSILVDAVNNKWIATTDGVWVLSPDGTEVLATLTIDNSKIIENEVLSLTTNPQDGKIYFGTKKGLSVASSLSVEPAANYKIRCYPQPFRIPEDNEIVIEGLETDTQIKIATIDGEFVRTINTASRKGIWDGKDQNGNLVSSGIYLVLANSVTNNSSAVAKFAVIRK